MRHLLETFLEIGAGLRLDARNDLKNLVFGLGGDAHRVENTRRGGMELDEGEVKLDMRKFLLLGNNRVNHICQCRMNEMHLGVLLLGLLVTRCIFAHRTGTIDGTIHDNTDFCLDWEATAVGVCEEEVSVNGGILIWIIPRLNETTSTAVVVSASVPEAGLSLVKNLMEVCILIAFCLINGYE